MKIGIACRYTYKQQPGRSILHSDALLSLLNVRPTATAPSGSGTMEDPYVPTQLSHWAGLAAMDAKKDPMFILTGGRLIARWGTNTPSFVDYCTDVTPAELQKIVKSEALGKLTDDPVHKIGNMYKEWDVLIDVDPKLPSYTRKALRVRELDDRAAAYYSRRLLVGATDCGGCPELASTVCSLFIAESHRSPTMFVVSLMLLDLIETTTTYGRGDKRYTWKSMLMYGTDDIPGRGSGVKAMGKHPMASVGSVAQSGRLYTNNDGLQNRVQDGVISIFSIWLTHYMALNHRDCEYRIIRAEGHTAWTGTRQTMPRDIPGKSLTKACGAAVTARLNTHACLIGGTAVKYENLAGDEV
jgi:hypothetical protein